MEIGAVMIWRESKTALIMVKKVILSILKSWDFKHRRNIENIAKVKEEMSQVDIKKYDCINGITAKSIFQYIEIQSLGRNNNAAAKPVKPENVAYLYKSISLLIAFPKIFEKTHP